MHRLEAQIELLYVRLPAAHLLARVEGVDKGPRDVPVPLEPHLVMLAALVHLLVQPARRERHPAPTQTPPTRSARSHR